MAIIAVSLDNPFYSAMAQSAKAEAQRLGYDARVAGHDDDRDVQGRLIDQAIRDTRLLRGSPARRG